MFGKVAIVGAGGVGTAIAYASLIRGASKEIALYDLNAAKVEAEVLDLNHGLRFAGSSHVIGADTIDVCSDADIVVITAGAKQRPGETRLDLAGRNADMFREMVPALVDAAPGAVFLVVTNPVDVMTYGTLRLSGLPPSRVIGSGTVLDTSRLHYLLARRCGVDVRNIHAYIGGEHGDSEFPLWSTATVGGVPITAWTDENGLPVSTGELDAIADEVKHAAYRIIEGKGATTYAIGLAVTEIMQAVLTDLSRILPVSSLVDDVCLSLPSVVARSGVTRVLDIPLSAAERAALDASRTTIRTAIEAVGFDE
ncbi:MAG: L-lactate dehydrogenase [Acidimicrobiia bacterium]|nr:L-lactate dehydrogenase [Acidimicrobiia bacterium]